MTTLGVLSSRRVFCGDPFERIREGKRNPEESTCVALASAETCGEGEARGRQRVENGGCVFHVRRCLRARVQPARGRGEEQRARRGKRGRDGWGVPGDGRARRGESGARSGRGAGEEAGEDGMDVSCDET